MFFTYLLTLKWLGEQGWEEGGRGQFDYSCGFSRTVFSTDFIELPQVFWNFWRFSSSILAISLVANKLMTLAYNRRCDHFFYLQHTVNRSFNNCVKLYWHWINSSWNIKRRRVRGMGDQIAPNPQTNYLQKDQT